jgi:hypothetical protein
VLDPEKNRIPPIKRAGKSSAPHRREYIAGLLGHQSLSGKIEMGRTPTMEAITSAALRWIKGTIAACN